MRMRVGMLANPEVATANPRENMICHPLDRGDEVVFIEMTEEMMHFIICSMDNMISTITETRKKIFLPAFYLGILQDNHPNDADEGDYEDDDCCIHMRDGSRP